MYGIMSHPSNPGDAWSPEIPNGLTGSWCSQDERLLGLQVALEDFQAKRRELLLIRQEQGADESLAVLSSALERVGGGEGPVGVGG